MRHLKHREIHKRDPQRELNFFGEIIFLSPIDKGYLGQKPRPVATIEKTFGANFGIEFLAFNCAPESSQSVGGGGER